MSRCVMCGSEILWVTSEERGERAPLDPHETTFPGNRWQVTDFKELRGEPIDDRDGQTIGHKLHHCYDGPVKH